jgi:hypothetical protein
MEEKHLRFARGNNMRKATTFEEPEITEQIETEKKIYIDADMYYSEEEIKISIFNRMFLWKGVIRRFLLYIVNRSYINKSYLKRQGKCLRCGACCKLAFKRCPYLKKETNENYSCIKHESFRTPNCIIFPIDPSDIKDRNIISKKPCGYSFGLRTPEGSND